ncbi:MAG: bifunctional UDP-N-acetylglucosamine diphosphorylase/glucosamine-1-phosphate N-acetyltransferase GlmU [Candidatus Eutrophobiaceae bacterium]
MNLDIVILAAGQGKRMHSSLPKVLHRLAGRSLLERVCATATLLDCCNIHVIYGHGGERLRAALPDLPVRWVEQRERKGTGHALMQALPMIPPEHQVLVLYGDVPLLSAKTLRKLLAEHLQDGLSLLSFQPEDPTGYGRIVRDSQGDVACIVEQADADAEELGIREVNSGIMLARADHFSAWLSQVENHNAQQEYYLTECARLAVAAQCKVRACLAECVWELQGVNDCVQLAEMERQFQGKQAESLLRQGVTMADPSRFDLRGELRVGEDVFIDINALFEGEVNLGHRVSIGAHCCLRDVVIGDDVDVRPNCVIEEAVIGKGCRIGPFARIRPGAKLEERVSVGNFVEIKNSHIGSGSKINHLSYVGDTEAGQDVNVGAGAITCNYDGARKHRTKIGDAVFVGANAQLIAPVEIAHGATIAAGAMVTRDVEANALAISRTKQRNIPNWPRPGKKI